MGRAHVFANACLDFQSHVDAKKSKYNMSTNNLTKT